MSDNDTCSGDTEHGSEMNAYRNGYHDAVDDLEDEVLEIIDEVEATIEDEDFHGATREQVLEGSFRRLRDHISRHFDTDTGHSGGDR